MKTAIIIPILMSSLTLTIVRNEDKCPHDCTNCEKCPPGYYLHRNEKICYGCPDGTYNSLCDASVRCEKCDTCSEDMVRTECTSEHNFICGCQEGYVEDKVQGRCVPQSTSAQTTMWTTTEPSTTTRNQDSVTSQPADDSTPGTTERDRKENGESTTSQPADDSTPRTTERDGEENGESTTFQPGDDSTPRTTERDGKESWIAVIVASVLILGAVICTGIPVFRRR